MKRSITIFPKENFRLRTCLIVLIVVLFQLSCEYKNDDTWVECTVPCSWTEGKIIFLRKHIHPIMAEYERKIRLDIPDQNSVYCSLPTNAGGRTLINVYWIDKIDGFGPMLLLRDHWGEYLLDCNSRTTHRLLQHKIFHDQTFKELNIYDNMQYIGRIDGRKSPLQFIPASDSNEEKIKIRQ